MTDYLASLLFRPKELGRYRFAKLYKVFFVLFILSLLLVIPDVIDAVKFQGFNKTDRYTIESALNTRFLDMANKLPDCQIVKDELICKDTESVEIGTFSTIMSEYVIVFNPDGENTNDDTRTYIIFSKDGLIHSSPFGNFPIPYDQLPEQWRTVDFGVIREADEPDVAFYQYIIGGLNPLVIKLKPLIIAILIGTSLIGVIVRTLFFSFLFYLFFRENRFGQVYRVGVYAHIFPSILLLMLDLLHRETLSIIPTLITFVYMYKALMSTKQNILE